MKLPTQVKSLAHAFDAKADLRARAVDVLAAPPARAKLLTPSEVALLMSGVMSWVERSIGLSAMQTVVGQLVRHDDAWSSKLGRLPHVDGVVDASLALIAVTCRSYLEMAGVENVRSALAFWATERDPAVWQGLVPSA